MKTVIDRTPGTGRSKRSLAMIAFAFLSACAARSMPVDANDAIAPSDRVADLNVPEQPNDAAEDRATQTDTSGEQTTAIDANTDGASDAGGIDAADATADSLDAAGIDTRADTPRFDTPPSSDTPVLSDGPPRSDTGSDVVTIDSRADAPPTGNEVCATATRVTDGTSLPSESLSTAVDRPTACFGGAGGPVVYYSATIPAGHALIATALPRSAALDLVLRLMPACGSSVCAASANDTGPDLSETLVWRNMGSAAVTVIVAVGANMPRAGTFRLDVAIRPSTYSAATATASCEALSSSAIVAGLDRDDATTTILSLSFPLTFFGESISRYSLSTNGLMQIHGSTPAFPSSSRLNTRIPDPAMPNGLIAPFWDDLVPASLAPSDVRTAQFGSTPSRRWVTQWTNWALVGETDARLTFQIKLFETTHVIEFHYCSLTPGTAATRVTGSTASIGIEDTTGALGYQRGYRMAGSVTAGTSVRYVPIP